MSAPQETPDKQPERPPGRELAASDGSAFCTEHWRLESNGWWHDEPPGSSMYEQGAIQATEEFRYCHVCGKLHPQNGQDKRRANKRG